MSAVRPVAWVTGASRGIGRAIAEDLAHDYRLVLIARHAEPLEHLAKVLIERHALPVEQSPLVVALDVSDPLQVKAEMSRVLQQLPSVDVLVNSAGIAELGFWEKTSDAFNAMWQVNMLGIHHFCQEVIPVMQQQKKGYIFNIASMAGKRALPNVGAYCATKFGVVGYTEALYQALIPQGLCVTAICPSMVDTDMTDMFDNPKSKMISPKDMVRTVRYLLELSPTAVVPEVQVHCRMLVGIET